MNEMTELEHFRSEVPPPTPDALTAQEDRLLNALATAPAAGRRSRLVLAGLLTAAAVATAVVAGPTLISQDLYPTAYANSAIDVQLRGDEYVARIIDPFADHTLYTEAFNALGLDVALVLRPASPTGVGQIFRLGFDGTTRKDRLGGGLEPEGCTYGHPGCALTVTVTKGFSGKGTIYIGRPAKPSESYQNNADAGRKGESLEGYDPNGHTVAEVLAETRKRGLEVMYQIIQPAPNGEGFSVNPRERSAKVGDHWIVWAAEPYRQGAVRLLVSEKRVAKNPVYGD
ncbi:hypothetical protein ABGB18_44260 [Nonomuraea sp. B12E4]|uniref:hypothetical protein n=1 Tax=Nonomuraea sp. B12E4 TaxID=3153564 RepID=UPI00325CF59A